MEFSAIKNKFELLRPVMDERICRVWAASEAHVLGRGGIAFVAAATGLSRIRICTGLRELEPLIHTLPVRDLSTPASRQRIIRRPGGGRKLTEIKAPAIEATLEQMLAHETAGDPMSEQRWIRSSTRELSKRLKAADYEVSPPTGGRRLKKMGFSMKANKRRQVHGNCRGRNEQFHYIASQRERFRAAALPIIRVDTKKKELIGEFSNSGRTWCRQAAEVNEHDFPSAAVCKAVPYGIYDVTMNAGYVCVGTSANTPEFAAEAIARWWQMEGQVTYPKADQLLILADSGGSNSCQSRAWKFNLQEKLSDQFELVVTVCHYPTACSKWHPIEQRLFSFISINWAGKPLRTLETMLGYIRGTSTAAGLQVKAFVQEDSYKEGQKVSKNTGESLTLRFHTAYPKWNYTITPRSKNCDQTRIALS
jgi:hypothetical protein